VRNLVKLVLFFSSTFIIIFVAVTCLKFLALRVDWVKSLPPKPETTLTLILAAAHWALSLALFSSIILSLNYAARRKCFALTSIIFVMFLSFSFSFGISIALEQWKSVPPAQTAGIQMGDKGLILSNALNRNLTAVVLLEGTANPLGPRVMAIPDQPLAFHEATATTTNQTALALPPIPFGGDIPWFLQSLAIDIRLNAEMLHRKFTEGFFPYLIYVGSFIFLLCSLGYAIKFSAWPLANLFLATLAFRGILALVTFLNTPEMQETIDSFMDNKLPAVFALPLSFLSFGILVHIYSFFAFVVKRQVGHDD
jgi:hypothetical protein